MRAALISSFKHTQFFAITDLEVTGILKQKAACG